VLARRVLYCLSYTFRLKHFSLSLLVIYICFSVDWALVAELKDVNPDYSTYQLSNSGQLPKFTCKVFKILLRKQDLLSPFHLYSCPFFLSWVALLLICESTLYITEGDLQCEVHLVQIFYSALLLVYFILQNLKFLSSLPILFSI
jgi:hypothetical protein